MASGQRWGRTWPALALWGLVAATSAVRAGTAQSDTQPPDVILTAPLDGATLSASIVLSANASDDAGVVGVQFQLDNANLGAEMTREPYRMTWDTTAVTEGPHILRAVARDGAGNRGFSLSAGITLANATGKIPVYYAYSIQEQQPGPYTENNTHPLLEAAVLSVKWPSSEPARGQFDWTLLDRKIDAWTKDAHKQVFLKIVPYGRDPLAGQEGDEASNDQTPLWVYDQGVPKITFPSDGAQISVPMVWDEKFHVLYEEYIAALAARYNGDPRVAGFQAGFGHNGTLNAEAYTAGAAQFLDAGWTLDLWAAHIRKVVGLAQSYFTKPQLFHTTKRFLGAPGYLLRDHPDTIKGLLAYAAQRGAHVLFGGLHPDEKQFEQAMIPELVTYLGTLTLPAGFRLGFTDDWPLWVPPDRSEKKPGSTFGRNEEGFDKEFGYVFKAWDSIGRKYPIFFEFLTPEANATNRNGAKFDQGVYDVAAKWLFVPPPSDRTLPTVALTAPANGATVSGVTAISAAAADEVIVAGLRFKLDGMPIGAELTTAPYALLWDASAATNGAHLLSATARDAAGNRAAASVTVTVTGGNDPPVARDDAYGAAVNTPLIVSAPGLLSNDSDPNGDALKAYKDSQPSHGALNMNRNGSFTYTPKYNFIGTDTFTYHANDGKTDSPAATVSIAVTGTPNQAPVIQSAPWANPNPVRLPKTAAVNVAASDPDLGPGALTYLWSLVSGPAGGAASFSPNGTASSAVSTATFDRPGSYVLRVTVSDGATGVAATVPVAVLACARGDFDGEGEADILFRHSTSGEVFLWLLK